MGNHRDMKLLNEILREITPAQTDRANDLVKICMLIFINKYGLKSLESVGIYNGEALDHIFDNNRILTEIGEIDIPVFSELYEEYLLVNYRDKTGSFYTPAYIIDYMVEGSLMWYLERETGISKKLLRQYFKTERSLENKQLKKILKSINTVKIIDIACGTGLFLIRSLLKIFEYKKKIYVALGEEIDDFTIKRYIVENNIFGIDIQKNPVMIGKMVLSSLVYGSEKINYGNVIQINITVGDSLTENFFETVTKKGGFDIVIGNPPYLGEKGNKELFHQLKSTPFGKKYYEGKMDYFYFFIYKSLEMLKEKGILSYITTNYFITADGANGLRTHLKGHCAFTEIINFNDYEVFKSAKGQHNLIFYLMKGKDNTQPVSVKYIVEKDLDHDEFHSVFYKEDKNSNKVNEYTLSNQENLYDSNGHILVQQSHNYNHILEKIRKNSQYKLEQLCNINQGIVSGADKVTKDMLEKKISIETAKCNNIQLHQGIFVLSDEEVKALGFTKSPYLKPMYKNSDIQRYTTKNNTKRYILYIVDNIFSENASDDLVYRHLHNYKEILDKRRETILGVRDWYALQWPRNQNIFEDTKIVVPHRAKENRFALNRDSWYASADVYFITKKTKNIDWHFLLAQLNSKIMYFWLYNRGKRKGEYLELYANPLKNLPIIWNIHQKKREKISTTVEEIIQGGDHAQAQDHIDRILYDVYGFTGEEIGVIESLYKRNFMGESI